jgi:NADH-quinone oxidoreductase subunit G
MRVWFLKETRTIDVNDGLGANITIGARENQIYRITPRENNDVNSCWLPDSHRLNFKYLGREDRLKQPLIKGQPADWTQVISLAADQLKRNAGAVAMIASARLTNEELFLARRLATALGVSKVDVLPRTGEPDGILIQADRNPNTSAAKLLGLSAQDSGSRLKEIAAGVRSGAIKALVVLGEDATKCGIPEDDLRKLDALVVTDILPNKTTPLATALLPAAGWAEKRGSMVNIRGRLQRLNRAVDAPGHAREDWEILRDLIQAVSGSNGLYMIEDVFKQMAGEVKEFAGLNLSKIGDLGVQVLETKQNATK